jgi:hypothetical protein
LPPEFQWLIAHAHLTLGVPSVFSDWTPGKPIIWPSSSNWRMFAPTAGQIKFTFNF